MNSGAPEGKAVPAPLVAPIGKIYHNSDLSSLTTYCSRLHLSSSQLLFLCGWCCPIFRFLCSNLQIIVCPFLLATVLLLLRIMASDHPLSFLQTLFFLTIVRVMVFNTTFNNISAKLWRSVSLVQDTGLPGENNRPFTLSHNAVSSTHLQL